MGSDVVERGGLREVLESGERRAMSDERKGLRMDAT